MNKFQIIYTYAYKCIMLKTAVLDRNWSWPGALGVLAGMPGGVNERGVSATSGDVRTRATPRSERAQRATGAETADVQPSLLTLLLDTAYLHTTLKTGISFIY